MEKIGFHVTERERLESILAQGLIPGWGNGVPGVFFHKDLVDTQKFLNHCWINYPVTLAVQLDGLLLFEADEPWGTSWGTKQVVKPHRISVVST